MHIINVGECFRDRRNRKLSSFSDQEKQIANTYERFSLINKSYVKYYIDRVYCIDTVYISYKICKIRAYSYFIIKRQRNV